MLSTQKMLQSSTAMSIYTIEAISVDSPLSNDVTLIAEWVFYAVLCQVISIFGIGANVINAICFIKQGFHDPVNISLLGLAISDLGCLITLVWTNVCFTPAFKAADLPFDPVEIQYLTSSTPHITFARVTAWITAFITLERCLCIAAPLKVKTIFTPKRVTLVITTIFIILIFSVSPIYVVTRLHMKFDDSKNKTLLKLVHTENRADVETVSFAINNVAIPVLSFMVIIICTMILVIELHKKTRWRKKSAFSAQADIVSSRHQTVAKMVVIISTLFIACFLPTSFGFIAMMLTPEMSVDGKYSNILILIGALCFLLESINSSFNIFIYYRMSGKYRVMFLRIFCRSSVSVAAQGDVVPENYKHNNEPLPVKCGLISVHGTL